MTISVRSARRRLLRAGGAVGSSGVLRVLRSPFVIRLPFAGHLLRGSAERRLLCGSSPYQTSSVSRCASRGDRLQRHHVHRLEQLGYAVTLAPIAQVY